MPKIWTDISKNPSNVVVGNPCIGVDCWIGHFTILDASTPLFIGDRVVISSGAHIYTHESVSRHEVVAAPVTIQDDVVIGANAVVLPGCVIGKGAVIGAGAVVTKNTQVGAGEVWCGVPAKFLKKAVKP